MVRGMEILVPMENLIDKEAELGRLSREIAKKIKDFDLTQKKLDNPDFLKKAPEDVVKKERQKKSIKTQSIKEYKMLEILKLIN